MNIMTETANKRITRNALMLYVRMAIMTVISLYTSRIILKTLGVEDYGIYSVVAGIAVLFSFFNNALYTSTQRFLTFEIGKNDANRIKEVFTACINSHAVIAFIILLLSEAIGSWFLYNKLHIPAVRLDAAYIVFQLSLFISILGVLNAPYTASIIAYEKMSFFAWTSIVDSICKLLIVFILSLSDGDKLIFYSFLLFIWAFVKASIDFCYCRIRFKNCRYTWTFNKKYFHSIMNFSMWNLFKTAAIIGVSQGNNILINIFGGPAASAAMGITNQVNGTVYTFMQNVQIAFNPQITKNYASNDIKNFRMLIIRSAKFSSFLLFFLAIPFLINTEYILGLWLEDVPPHTANLCRLAIISVYIDALTGPLNTAVLSKGNIRAYQITTSILWASAIPCAWLLLAHSGIFDCILLAKIASQVCILLYSILYSEKKIDLSAALFLKKAVMPSILIFSSAYIASVTFVNVLNMNDTNSLIISILFAIILLPLMIFYIGMNSTEKEYTILTIQYIVKKK